MLTHLQIRDFAIIDLIDLEVRAGLTVLTGETGAGKSIVVDALALLAGGKGGAEVVRAGTERAELSATFDISESPAALREMLAEQSVDAEDELTVRRVIASDGRSRGYLNGVSVPLQLLRDVGALIVDIHGQHEFQSLTRASAQRELLDDFGDNLELAESVREAHKVWIALRQSHRRARRQGARSRFALELLRFQVSELKALDLKEGEVAQLTEERTRHSNRGRLAEAAQAAVGLLYDSDEGNAHATASRALAGIKTLSSVDQRLAKVIPDGGRSHHPDSRGGARAVALPRNSRHRSGAPGRSRAPSRRGRRAEPQASRAGGRARGPRRDARKRTRRARQRRQQSQRAQEEPRPKRSRPIASWPRSFPPRARPARARLSKDITARMQTLGMAGGRFLIDVTQPNGDPAAHGFDAVEFRVTANPGQPLRPLAKVASGGELARLSLAVQVACSAQDARCMVFDEVDSGVGGAVAEIVGRELKALGFSGQAICVTHLPQVARQGHHHLRVVEAHRRQDHAHHASPNSPWTNAPKKSRAC